MLYIFEILNFRGAAVAQNADLNGAKINCFGRDTECGESRFSVFV